MSKFVPGTFCAAFLALAYFGPVQAADRHVRISNETPYTMLHFYATTTARNQWQEDLLRHDVLKPGKSVDIDLDDGTGRCVFDLRAEFSGGRYSDRRNFNACKEASWTIHVD
jgi:hypothetical protein